METLWGVGGGIWVEVEAVVYEDGGMVAWEGVAWECLVVVVVLCGLNHGCGTRWWKVLWWGEGTLFGWKSNGVEVMEEGQGGGVAAGSGLKGIYGGCGVVFGWM